jgi:hypothetical protein
VASGPIDILLMFCEAHLFQGSPRLRLLGGRRVGSIVFFAKTWREPTQLRGFLCVPSSRGPDGAGKLALGSIRRPELNAAVRFSIAIVVVDLTR